MALLEVDRDWTSWVRVNADHSRRAVLRARPYSIEKADKAGFGTLLRVTRAYAGDGLPDAATTDALTDWEVALKRAVEAEARAMLAVVALGKGRAELLIYAREPDVVAPLIEALPGGARVERSVDPEWAEAERLLRSFD